MSFMITPTVSMRQWKVEVSSKSSTFFAPAAHDESGRRLLRVWPGHGFDIAESQLPGLYASIVEVMKKSAYWNFRATVSSDRQMWSVPEADETFGMVALRGPAGAGPDVDYRTATALIVEHATLRGLRIRLRAHLADSASAAPVGSAGSPEQLGSRAQAS